MITLRSVEAADLADLAQLEQTCFPDPWSESGLAILLAAPYGALCAVEDSTILGYLSYSAFPAAGNFPAEAEILRVAVTPHARRRGIARTLLEQLIADLSTPATLYLDVRTSNTAAQALYTSLGFIPCGTRPAFYGNEDALEMSLTH